MTPDRFRQLALSLPETAESAHMHHPDFRVRGKIFATLDYPAPGYAMVKLPPEQQHNFMQSDPAAFVAVKGKWGLQGATHVVLKAAKISSVRAALEIAWRSAMPEAAPAARKTPAAGRSKGRK